MFANERYKIIMDLIAQKSSVTVSELMKLFGVSIETIRRDLEYLEQQNVLSRVHGGAVSNKRTQPFSTLGNRTSEHRAEKQRLCQTACTFIQEHDVIALDSGSTAMELACIITQAFRNLTVVTNSPEILHVLAENDGFTVIQIGGQYLKSEQAFYGHLAEESIARLHFQKSFIFPSAISLQQGVGVFVHELVNVEKALMQNADEVFILADSSKFETTASIRLCSLFPHRLVTDDKLSDEIYNLYLKNHINIIR